MGIWNPEVTCTLLQKSGWACHKRLAKSAHFRMPHVAHRELMIPLDRSVLVTAYVNHASAANVDFPAAGIDGIEIRKNYVKGHSGKNGNPGIAASVTRHSPSLDPSRRRT